MKLIDTWQGSGDEGLMQAVVALKRKPYLYGPVFLPHDAQARDEVTGKQYQDVFKVAGFTVEIVPDIGVLQGIDTAKRMFPRLWVNEPECQTFLDAIPQYRSEWDEKRGMFKDKPYHDFTSHWADMLRYAAVSENRMTNETIKHWTEPPPKPLTRYG